MAVNSVTEVATSNVSEKSSLTDRLFDELLERIHNQEWSVGETFPSERALTDEYGVSCNAMRETISRLRALGVLSVSHGRRSTVAKMDSSSLGRLLPLMLALEGKQAFQDIYPVRYALELAAVELACANRTSEDLATMRAMILKMQENVDPKVLEYAKLDLDLHLQIAQASHNPLFEPLLPALSAFVIDLEHLGIITDPEDRGKVNLQHKAIINAIRDRDAPRAQQEMAKHLQKGSEYVTSGSVLVDGEDHVEIQVDPAASVAEF